MKIDEFINLNKNDFDSFAEMSHKAANREDYIQGGGGNTSVKLKNNTMAIKASGFSLSDIEKDKAYALLDYKIIQDFFISNIPSELKDVESEGADVVKNSSIEVEGLAKLRPSVEAGFHSILKKYVLHTHAVYANMVSCAANGEELCKKILDETGLVSVFVRYVNPGSMLTFLIDKKITNVEKEKGVKPDVIILENHGIVANADDANRVSEIHETANTAIAEHFGISFSDFPKIELAEENGQFISNTPWLIERLKSAKYDANFFTQSSLYPDQLVFIENDLVQADTSFDAKQSDFKACISSEDGVIYYNIGKSEALVMEQTLVCVIFIVEAILSKGYEVKTMNETDKSFISNWESEAYRKSMVK